MKIRREAKNEPNSGVRFWGHFYYKTGKAPQMAKRFCARFPSNPIVFLSTCWMTQRSLEFARKSIMAMFALACALKDTTSLISVGILAGAKIDGYIYIYIC